MKVLEVNFRDWGGGSPNMAVMITRELNRLGVEATLGVYEMKTSHSFVMRLPEKKQIKTPFIIWLAKKAVRKVTKPFRKYFEFRTESLIAYETNFKSRIDVNWINASDFDIVHLHSLNGDLISIKDIARIQKPVIWTLHDSWPCCGAEHYQNVLENDIRYQEGYTKKNKPASTKGIDLCRKVWLQKKKYLAGKPIVFTAPSVWELETCKASMLFSKNRCELIHNFVYTEEFYPKDKFGLRKNLCIPSGKTILGFGAHYGVDNPKSVKGSYYLIEALKRLKNKDDYFLVVFGPSTPEFTSKLDIEYFESKAIYNNQILSCLYNICDCFVNPTVVESFGLTTLEAISCGIPVAAFDATGTKDIIVHKENGYLARPYDIDDLRDGIEFCVKNSFSMKEKCVSLARTNFDKDAIMRQYIDLYEDVLKNASGGSDE